MSKRSELTSMMTAQAGNFIQKLVSMQHLGKMWKIAAHLDTKGLDNFSVLVEVHLQQQYVWILHAHLAKL
jgi:hypothetical protein